MEETFGKQIKQFAQSVDIVDKETWKGSMSKIEEYLKKLGIVNFRLLVERILDGDRPVLVSEWKMGESEWGLSVKDPRGKYLGQNAFAYDTQKCLWVVGEKKKPLSEDSGYVDLWSNTKSKEIPKSRAAGNIYTSIFIPLLHECKINGLVTFESMDYLECTPARKGEFGTIAEAIKILFQLHSTHKIRKKSTDDVLKELTVKDEVFLPKPKDQVFLAYSEKSDQKVIEAIKGLLSDKYGDEFEVIDWKESLKPGSISRKMAKDILNCEYGICYFSEESDESSEKQFRDNPNVLIEAGMFYILSKKKTISNFKGWIPIREEDSRHTGKLPFDLADLRILWVDRQEGENGKLDEREFKEKLANTIDCLLEKD